MNWREHRFYKYRYWIVAVLLFLIALTVYVSRPRTPRAAIILYVAKDGKDSNNGSEGAPFLTIQKAASVAQSLDVVVIGEGTYRETVTPSSSGVTFRSDDGAAVVVSGLEQVTSAWTLHTGSIYKTTISLPNANNYNENIGESNTSILANQIFQGGKMAIHARFPNIGSVEEMFDLTKFKKATGNIQDTYLTDGSLPPGLVGGWLCVNGWFLTQTKQITAHSGSRIDFASLISQNDEQNFRKFYYVNNRLVLLDAANEWHYENGTLYFWPPSAGPPANVEYKKRNWGFDLRGKSNISIVGIQFIGCDPAVTSTTATGFFATLFHSIGLRASSSNIVLDNIRARYANHSFLSTNAGGAYTKAAEQSGTKLIASNCVIKNSEFKYSGAVGVWLGPNSRAENCLFEYMVYDGMWGSPVKNHNGSYQVITRNTSRYSGRGFVELSYHGSTNMDISYNDVSFHNILSNDGGAVYSQADKDHTGTRIHHNWFHDSGTKNVNGLNGINVTGGYLDQSSGPVTYDHNVHWNGPPYTEATGDWYAESVSYAGTAHHKLYNNTFATTDPFYGSYVDWGVPNGNTLTNNIFRHEIRYHGNTTLNNRNFLSRSQDPKFSGQGEGGLRFRLASGSPAINAGAAVSGITDGSNGTPDIGAYEYGGADWVAGYSPDGTLPPIPPDTIPDPPDPPSLKDTVIHGTIKKGYRFKSLELTHESYIPEAGKIEAETGELYKAGIENGSVVCCIDPGATLKYGTKTSTSKILIRYSRGNPGSGTLRITVGGETKDLSFESTGGWSVFREKTFDIKAGTGAFEFSSSVQGPANLDYYEFLKP